MQPHANYLKRRNGVAGYSCLAPTCYKCELVNSTQGKVWTDKDRIRYERGRAGDEEADGTRERNGECTAVRHERKGGADLCAVAQRTRANEGNGSARRRSTREGTQTKGEASLGGD
ncbi:hypothetical protein BC826DRAFT_1181107 [Russula brevipes]|nr:hypothetical protein BC826DRAFT_1181107 [Russula brevipes]